MLVAGRYQLVDALGDPRAPGPLPRWQARDTLLQRSVVLSLVPEGPLAEPTLQACRAGAHLTTSALVRVLDVLDLRDNPATARPSAAAGAIVAEWVEGESLESLLVRDGPLPDAAARAVGLAAGDVLADIARICPAELGDLLLRPADVIVCPDGRVAVALDRTCPPRHTPAGPAEQVAALVYAALTARWPRAGRWAAAYSEEVRAEPAGDASADSAAETRLEPLPDELPGAWSHARELADRSVARVGAASGGTSSHPTRVAAGAVAGPKHPTATVRVASALPTPPGGPRPGAPHRVRAGIDAGLDAVVARALTRDHDVPLATLMADLRALDLGSTPEPAELATPPRLLARAVPVAVGLVLAAGFGLLAWQAADTGQTDVGGIPVRPRLLHSSSSPTPSVTPSPKPQPSPVDLTIAGVRTLDPYGDGHEHDDLAGAAIDANPATSWRTALYYRRPDFGGLKPGVGLLLDLGAPTRLGTLTVSSVSAGGAFDVYAADTPLSAPPPDDPLARVGFEKDVQRVDLDGRDRPAARWVLLWWRELPPATDVPSAYRLQVSEIRMTGWPASNR